MTKLKKYAAIFLGSLVAAAIVVGTLYNSQKEPVPVKVKPPVKAKFTMPVPVKPVKALPQVKTLQQIPVRKTVIKPPVKTGPFYLNAAPAGLKYLWSDARAEISAGTKGALVFDLPAKVVLKVKKGSKVIFEMDSRFQQQGCIYRTKGEIVYLELVSLQGGDSKTYIWQSKSGQVDIFQP